MKKIIRSTNDLLLAVLMGGLSIFLLLSKKIITGVENGLGGGYRPRQAHQQHPSGRILRADQGHPDGPRDRGYEEEQL